MTTFNSIDNIYRIDFGNTTFYISIAKDFLHYLSEEQVRQISTYVNNISQYVKLDITKVLTKEQLSPLCVALSDSK